MLASARKLSIHILTTHPRPFHHLTDLGHAHRAPTHGRTTVHGPLSSTTKSCQQPGSRTAISRPGILAVPAGTFGERGFADRQHHAGRRMHDPTYRCIHGVDAGAGHGPVRRKDRMQHTSERRGPGPLQKSMQKSGAKLYRIILVLSLIGVLGHDLTASEAFGRVPTRYVR